MKEAPIGGSSGPGPTALIGVTGKDVFWARGDPRRMKERDDGVGWSGGVIVGGVWEASSWF